ncbi:uncharacterized protein F5147DRAFT_783255 [Suillus discolor]|uniref:Uncharacterized protein n=1 Tax=Suillus discolor TaxID=1912936 RepID=A0A9P7JL42_9AGAM|nr:uncharacterized protein F5147DRAFT_783255 [Suillus discolor]KAG2082549.1 hypothetical protein F5147DRAFT_783255 [Suillus discolor]
MSASELANAALDAAMEDIRHLMVRSMKLQVGHPNAMVFAHEITKIIARSLWEHREVSTSFSPMLLSCAAEIRDHSDPVTRKIVTLPDWSAVNMDDPYHITPAPTIPAPQPLVIADKPSTVVASPEVLDSAELPALKFNLFVAGTKRKADGTDSDIQEETRVTEPKRKVLKTNPAPQQKTATSSKRRKIVRSKRFVSNDEDESADGAVIIVKKPGTGALAKHVVPVQPASKGSLLSNLSDVEELEEPWPSRADSPIIRPDDWSDDNAVATTEWPSQRLHPTTCVQCIKEDRPCVVRLSRKIGEVCKSCPACEDKKVKCVRLIPEAEDALRNIVAKKKAAAASKATAKEKKPHGCKQAKPAAPSTSRVRSQRSVSSATRSTAKTRQVSPTEHDSEDEALVPSSDVDAEMQTPAEEVPNNNAPTVADVEQPLIDFDSENSADDAGNKDMQFAGDFGVDTETPLMDLDIPPSDVQSEAPPPPKAPVPLVVANVVQVNAPPPTVHAPPVILPQVTARDLLLGMEALGRRMNDLQVSNTQVQAWHAQMGERVTALEQDWEKKFNLLEAKVSNLELKTLNNVMVSGNLASLINSIHPANNPNPSFAPPPIAVTSTFPYDTLPSSWRPAVSSTPAPTDELSVSHVGRRYTHAWDELHVLPETSDPAGPSKSPGAASVSQSADK